MEEKESKKEGVTVLNHPINRGLGGALGTGLAFIKSKDFNVAVTFDADGQHDPRDIRKVLQPILRGKAEVVIGSRTLKNKAQIPWDRRIVIFLSNFLTWVLFGIKTSDSQSGFRAFSRKAIEKIKIKIAFSPDFLIKRLKLLFIALYANLT